MIQFSERISVIAVSFVGAVALALVGIIALHPSEIPALSGPLGVCIGALAAIVQSSPRPHPQSSVGSAETVNVEAPPEEQSH